MKYKAFCNQCGVEQITDDMGSVTECNAKNCESTDIGYEEIEYITKRQIFKQIRDIREDLPEDSLIREKLIDLETSILQDCRN